MLKNFFNRVGLVCLRPIFAVSFRSNGADVSCESSQLFVLSVVDRFELLPVIYWQSSGKVEKFSCIFSGLEMLRESTILVSLDSIAPLYLFGYMLGGAIEHRRLERRQESLVMQNPWAGLTKPGGNEEAHEVLGEKRG